jgi:predicted dienelactone hydrolase
MRGTAFFLVLALMFIGCLESNPQPTPLGPGDTGSHAGGGEDTGDVQTVQNEDISLTPEPDAMPPGLDLESEKGCFNDLCPASPDAAPDPSIVGPYPVGVRTVTVDLLDANNESRTLRVEIWYPTTDEFRDGPFEGIDFTVDAPPELTEMVTKYKDSLPPIKVDVVRDAPVRTTDGPYPLVIFSHGAYGIRFQSVFFTVPLASHGYVVAAPDHNGNTLYDMILNAELNYDDLVASAFDRPLDCTAVMDDMLQRNAEDDDPLYGAVNPDSIGISGHSFGGYTSLNLGFTDPRIKAVLPHAPATTPLGLLGFNLAEFPVPMMMMTGGLDKTLDTQPEMAEPYEEFPSPKYYFEVTNGGHFTYSDICQLDLLHIANDMGIPDADNALNDGCAEYNTAPEIAHPIINQFGIAFFNYYLRNSELSIQYFDDNAAAAYPDVLLYKYEP